MSSWKDKTEFKKEVIKYADKLAVALNSIYVCPMKRKLASCSTAGNLNFNDELKSFLKSICCKPARIKIKNNFTVPTTSKKTGAESFA